MRSVQIPQELRDALEHVAGAIAPAVLQEAARRVSDGYRGGSPLRLSRDIDLAAYALTRLPATYAALALCLLELEEAPRSLIDYGAGPGTTAWAARARFGALERITLVEQNTNWAGFPLALDLPEVHWRHADLRHLAPSEERFDLAVISYVLNELSAPEQARLVDLAWTGADRALLIVEPGTPDGYRRILAARRQLIAAGANISAPCPHANACPLQSGDWCHFAVRVERTRAHRLAKGGELGYEDEKFSYVLATPGTAAPTARILRHPLHAPGRVELRICGQTTVQDRVVRRKDAAWKRARKIEWGDRWEP